MKGRHARRDIKFWEEGMNFTGTLWVIGDYLILINTQVHPFYLTEIHDQLLCQNLRELFRNLWELV